MKLKLALAIVLVSSFASCRTSENSKSDALEVSTVSDPSGQQFELATIEDRTEIKALSHLIEAQGAEIHFQGMSKVSCKTEMDKCSIAVRRPEQQTTGSYCQPTESGRCVYLNDGETVFRISSEIAGISESYRKANFEWNSKIVEDLTTLGKKYPNLTKNYTNEVDGTKVSFVELNLTDGRIYCASYELPYTETSSRIIKRNKCYIVVDSTKNPLP